MGEYYIVKDETKYFFYKIENEVKRYAMNPCIIGDYRVYNPTEAQLLADGWTEEEEVIPERTLSDAISEKVAAIREYAEGDSVKLFTLDNVEMWFDSEERASLDRRFTCEQKADKTETTIWWDNVAHIMSIENALQLLVDVENYAAECYDNTELHIKAVSEKTTIEEVDAYDFTTGYPTVLTFNASKVQSSGEINMSLE